MNLEKYLVIRKKYTYFIAIKVLWSCYMRRKMSGLGYICKTVVGGFEAYKGMCVIN